MRALIDMRIRTSTTRLHDDGVLGLPALPQVDKARGTIRHLESISTAKLSYKMNIHTRGECPCSFDIDR